MGLHTMVRGHWTSPRYLKFGILWYMDRIAAPPDMQLLFQDKSRGPPSHKLNGAWRELACPFRSHSTVATWPTCLVEPGRGGTICLTLAQ